jgi:hypothetical protein
MYRLFIILFLVGFLAACWPALFAMATIMCHLLLLSHVRQLQDAETRLSGAEIRLSGVEVRLGDTEIRLTNDIQTLAEICEEFKHRLSFILEMEWKRRL